MITAEKIRDLSGTSKTIQTLDSGLEEWGVYFVILEFDTSGSLMTEIRVFVYGDHYAYYMRAVDKSRVVWRDVACKSNDDAVSKATRMLNASSSRRRVTYGAPLLIQFELKDVLARQKGEIPPARYRGVHLHESLYGSVGKSVALDVKHVSTDFVVSTALAAELSAPITSAATSSPSWSSLSGTTATITTAMRRGALDDPTDLEPF